MVELLKSFWWLIPLLLIGIFYGAIKELKRVDHTKYLNKPKQDKNKPN